MMSGFTGPEGETVAAFSSYEAAQKAVSGLIAGDVPAKEIAIVGRGLRSIERVTGRLGYATAARQGAMNGLLLGLLFSAIFVLGAPNAAIQLFIGVMLVGIAIGMLLSIIMYSIVRRRRDYASVTHVLADHYDVTVLPTSIHRARQVLGHQPRPAAVPPATAPVPPPAAEPPRYGERPAPGPDDQAGAERPAPGPHEAPRHGERPAPGPEEPPRYGERIDPAGGPAPAPPIEEPRVPGEAPEPPR